MMQSFHVSSFTTFFMIGVSHHTLDLSQREKFSLSETQQAHIIKKYQQTQGNGIFILATCNRTEVYAFGNCPRRIIDLFCLESGIDQETFFNHQILKQNQEAINHLLRVATGLESQILGDFEIIGQLKKAFSFAKNLGATTAFLDRLNALASQASKRVKNETDLSSGTCSVAYAAVQQLKIYIQEHESLQKPKIVLIGTGKIGRIASANLAKYIDNDDITLLNRSNAKAEKIAKELKLKAAPYQNLSEELSAADIVLVATGAPTATVGEKHFQSEKKRLIIDLSVPRNVEHSLGEKQDITLVDVDQLSEIMKANREGREEAIPQAIAIIEEMQAEFNQWLESRKVAPTLKAVNSKMAQWKEKEVFNFLKKNPGCSAEEVNALADKLIHKITGQIAKQLRSVENSSQSINTLESIFELGG